MMHRSKWSAGALALLLGGVMTAAGCVRRTITITSDPQGALVWLNDREVGRTPLDVEFLYYGTYDVRLVHEGYESLLTSGHAVAPWWDWIGIDLLAEMVPADLESEVHWHYEMEPVEPDPEILRAEVVERARELRERLRAEEDAAATDGS